MAHIPSAEEQKLDKLIKRKAQLLEREQALKASLRKKENARKFNHGGLVKKAGLADLTDDQLLGLLLEQQDRRLADPSSLTVWETKAHTQTIKAKKQPVIVKFEQKPDNDITAQLKAHKLRWNRYAQHWEGDVSVEGLEQLTAHIGDGPITRIDPS